MRKMRIARQLTVEKTDIVDRYIQNDTLILKATYLAQTLDLPIRHCLPLHFGVQNIIDEYQKDPDAFLNLVLKELEVLYPSLESAWKKEFAAKIDSGKRWFLVPNEDRDAMVLLIDGFNETAFSSPLALIEICLLFAYSRTVGKVVSELIPWFIRYGSIELITKAEVLDKLKHNFYREYIARLPPEELHEFLLSNNQGERVMAKNKFKSELEEG